MIAVPSNVVVVPLTDAAEAAQASFSESRFVVKNSGAIYPPDDDLS
jgi:hypothetical protein